MKKIVLVYLVLLCAQSVGAMEQSGNNKTYQLLLALASQSNSSSVETIENASGKQKLDQQLLVLVRQESDNVSFEKVKKLLELGANVNSRSKDGSTPLMYAARSGLVDVCKLLIECGADSNAQNSLGVTPLMKAVLSESVELCKVLLEHGAQLSTVSTIGKTALWFAVLNAPKKICKVLVDYSYELPKRVATPEQRNRIIQTLFCWKKLNMPKDPVYLLLCSNQELKKDLEDVLLDRVRNRKTVPSIFVDMLVLRIADYTIMKLKSLMKNIQNIITDKDMKIVFNPETLRNDLDSPRYALIRSRIVPKKK